MLPNAAYSSMGEKSHTVVGCNCFPSRETIGKLNSEAPDHSKSLKLFFTNSTLAIYSFQILVYFKTNLSCKQIPLLLLYLLWNRKKLF